MARRIALLVAAVREGATVDAVEDARAAAHREAESRQELVLPPSIGFSPQTDPAITTL